MDGRETNPPLPTLPPQGPPAGDCCYLAAGLAGEGSALASLGPGRGVAVLVSGGKVAALGAEALQEAGDRGAEIHDLGELWLSPGVVDAHVHFYLGGTVEENLARNIEAGVTAVRDLGHKPGVPTSQTPDSGAPLVVAAGVGLGAKGEGYNWLAERLSGPEEYARAARDRAASGHRVVKVFYTGLLSFENPGEVEHPSRVSLAELKAAVDAASEAGLPVAIHGSGIAAARDAVRAGVRTLEHGFFLDEPTLEEMARAGVAWLPTLSPVVAHARDEEGRHSGAIRENLWRIVEMQRRAMRAGAALGVEMILGSDAGSYCLPHGLAAHLEIDAWMEAGLAASMVFRAATVEAARLLGLDKEVGSLLPGRRAFMLAVKGDPREDPRRLGGAVWNSLPRLGAAGGRNQNAARG